MAKKSESPVPSEFERATKRARSKINLHSVSFLLGICVLVYLLLLGVIVYLVNNILPTDLKISDEINNPDSFIAERAIYDLEALTSIGPRVTGSDENEYLAVEFLTRRINAIIQESNANQEIELDVQETSGAFLLVRSRLTVYDVRNIVVKINGMNTSTSVLVNSHYDSMPTSPGGCDDGINVVAMLEILRKLSKSSVRPLHNIIFLFNGAEEGGLMASHAFISQHKWAQECKVIINLEAAGHGGKITLFQTGPKAPWLLKYYSSVPHPYGQVAGEEIFQSGLVPSDTDFRIFRDYGGLIGYDMALSSNGYRYHTKYDDFENIPNGTYQQVGDNTLFLVKSLANAPELLEEMLSGDENIVYFDILGLFMISYTTWTADILNYSTVAVSVLLFIISLWGFKLKNKKASIKFLLLALLVTLSGWLIALLAVVFIGWILDLLNSTMSWYANPWILGGLYVVPTVALSGSLFPFIRIKEVPLHVRCQIQGHIVRLLWTVILLAGSLLKLRSVYMLMVPVLFNCAAFLIILVFRWQSTRRIWLFVYFGTLLIPTLITLYQILLFLILFIPLMGRSSPNTNPEFLIGLLVGVSTIFATSPYVALTSLMNNVKYYFICLGAIFVIFVIFIFTPPGFPYSGDPISPAPQRYFLTHTKRIFRDDNGVVTRNDSGVLLLNIDRNSPKKVESYVSDIARAQSVTEDCHKYILCGLPLSQTKMLQIVEYSSWIPSDEPVFDKELNFNMSASEIINATLVRYGVTVSGADRLNIFLFPRPDMALVNVNFTDFSNQMAFNYPNELLLIRSTSRRNWNLNFTFDIAVPFNYDGITTDVAVSAIYVHEKINNKTQSFKNMIEQFPDWADVVPDLGYYISFAV